MSQQLEQAEKNMKVLTDIYNKEFVQVSIYDLKLWVWIESNPRLSQLYLSKQSASEILSQFIMMVPLGRAK